MVRYKFKMPLFLLGIFLTGLLFCWAVPSWAAITIEQPLSPVYQGQPLVFNVEISETSPVNSEFYYRPVGIRYFQRLPVNLNNDGSAEVILPPSVVVSPGIEYYIKVVDGSGKIATSPFGNAPRNPHRVNVIDAPPAPELKLISPDRRRPFQGDSLLIQIKVDPKDIGTIRRTATLLLDDTDITALVTFTEDKISFSTPLIPDPGEHTLHIAFADTTGSTFEESWTFEVGGEEEVKKGRDAYAQGRSFPLTTANNSKVLRGQRRIASAAT